MAPDSRKNRSKLISFILPAYNEEKNLTRVTKDLIAILGTMGYEYEIIYVNDGSQDNTRQVLAELKDSINIKVINFSRNFGKEIAITAGLQKCEGVAAMLLDSDGQHPINLIPNFVKKWEDGADVVVGVRQANKGEGWVKRYGSKQFYRIMSGIARVNITPGSTDFRLIDRKVINEFCKFTERNRISRGLIDWLGFERSYIYFEANPRLDGNAGYTFRPLLKLALNSFVSLSLFPLKLSGYLGILITTLATFLGCFIVIEKYILNDPLNLVISGSASLAVVLMFLIGIVLMCQGLIALYIAHIYEEVINRPLYVLDDEI